MEIIYNWNPLNTIVQLNEFEKKEFWYKLKLEELADTIHTINYSLREGQSFNLDRAREESNPSYFFSTKVGNKSEIDERIDELHSCYLAELSSSHCGDCTCVPTTCLKCYAEDMLGVNTIPGIGKHGLYKIDAACRSSTNINEAISNLENPSIKADWDGWEAYAPRWTKEYQDAANWLRRYKEIHNF